MAIAPLDIPDRKPVTVRKLSHPFAASREFIERSNKTHDEVWAWVMEPMRRG